MKHKNVICYQFVNSPMKQKVITSFCSTWALVGVISTKVKKDER